MCKYMFAQRLALDKSPSQTRIIQSDAVGISVSTSLCLLSVAFFSFLWLHVWVSKIKVNFTHYRNMPGYPLCLTVLKTKDFRGPFWLTKCFYSSADSTHMIVLMEWQVLNFFPSELFTTDQIQNPHQRDTRHQWGPLSQPYFPEDLLQKCCVTVRGIRSGFTKGRGGVGLSGSSLSAILLPLREWAGWDKCHSREMLEEEREISTW